MPKFGYLSTETSLTFSKQQPSDGCQIAHEKIQSMLSRRQLLCLTATLPLLTIARVADASKSSKAARKEAKKRAQKEALEAMQRGEILPLTQVLDIALRHVPGRVIELDYKAGPQYEIKILTPDGRIREVKLDARTGEVLKIKDKG